MRAKEFIYENKTGSLQDDVARALPATYVIPKLQNQDPYRQYRFGVAIAQAKGRAGREQSLEKEADYAPESVWGENQVVVSFDPHVDRWIDAALKEIGLTANDKKLISTPRSEESKDAQKSSPIRAFRGYPR